MTLQHERRLGLIGLALALCGCIAGAVPSAKAVQFLPGVAVGTIQNTQINEASGIAASRRNSNVLWVHNDSGDTARVFAVNRQGINLGAYHLNGITATDCEDIAIGPGPDPDRSYLYLGDIGDNNAVRGPSATPIKIYRVPEPVVSSTQSPVDVNLDEVETFTLQYSDGARDAETLMVDPWNGDIYVVSKRESRSRLYRATSPLSASTPVTLQFLTQLPWGWATAGDISPDGREILVRGYFNASLWSRPTGGTILDAFLASSASVPLGSDPQGEAICFDPAGLGSYALTEGVQQPLYYFAQIPEPSGIAMLAAGGAAATLAFWLRSRRPG
jgi:hypothetical protein